MNERLKRTLLALAPVPHFMSLAPLDAWIRLLFFPWARVGPAYLPRVVVGLFTSAIGTAITLPERLVLAPVLWALGRRRGHVIRHGPGVVVVLGYPRSGTTHLHYLLSCDPAFWTPRWHHALAPQGFVLSWTLLRFALVPFLSNKRLMDDMAFGPEWPAEDEFAVNNWRVASPLPGRLVVPRLHAYYHRFHALEGLAPREAARWRACTWAFAWKMSRLAGQRALLLKSPTHTARVAALADLYGSDGVRFVHITRDPRAVVRSNLSMLRRARVYHLHDPPAERELERRQIEELAATEAKFLRESAVLPPGRLARVRYQDLVADPMGELRRVYGELGLEWSGGLEQRLTRYLRTVADYRAATPERDEAGPGDASLDAVARLMGHDRPTVPRRELPPPEASPAASRRAWPAMLAASVVILAAWVGVARLAGDRCDWLVWPAGAVVGYAGVRAARAGSPRLGFAAAAATLAVLIAVAWPATFFGEYFPRPVRNWEWRRDVWRSTYRGFFSSGNIPWVVFGLLSAYRFASRRHLRPPGAG